VTSGMLEGFMLKAMRFNPSVAMHELRSRMRGWRPFATMLAYALLAATAVLITLVIANVGSNYYSSGPGSNTEPMGLIAFSVLTYTQMALLLILLPVQAAAAITMEREKRTMEMLRATLLSPRDVVGGKLVALVAFTLVLLAATVPIATWCLLLGGLEPRVVLFSYTYLFATGLWVSTLGLVFSAWRPRSLSATASAYFTIAVFLGAVPAIYLSVIAAIESASSGGMQKMGTDGALSVIAILAGVAGWLSLLVARSLGALLGRRLRSGLSTTMASIVGLGLLGGALYWMLEHLLPVLATATPWVPFILHPVVGLTGILFEELGQELVFGYGHAPAAPVDLQLLIWLQSGLALLIGAGLLWLLAVERFQAYREKDV